MNSSIFEHFLTLELWDFGAQKLKKELLSKSNNVRCFCYAVLLISQIAIGASAYSPALFPQQEKNSARKEGGEDQIGKNQATKSTTSIIVSLLLAGLLRHIFSFVRLIYQ